MKYSPTRNYPLPKSVLLIPACIRPVATSGIRNTKASTLYRQSYGISTKMPTGVSRNIRSGCMAARPILYRQALSKKYLYRYTASITSANESDCKISKAIFESFWPKRTKYLAADKGYDDKSLRGICQRAGALLITPMKRYKNMNPERKKHPAIYRSKIGRKIYSQRSKTTEPLYGHIKDLFDIEKLRLKGLENVKSFLSFCVWVYQTLIYYNFIYQRPLRRLKDLVCAV